MFLPKRIFFTGVPGSRWSGVAQLLETVPGFNTSDRTPERTFIFKPFSDHLGAYFGSGMEFSLDLNTTNIDQAHATSDSCRLIKAHEWSFKLKEIKEQYPHDWIIMVYRPDVISFAWWNGAGGFNITYPKYDAFIDATNMMSKISKMNQCILEFAYKHDATWNHLTSRWMKEHFNIDTEVDHKFSDMLITIIK